MLRGVLNDGPLRQGDGARRVAVLVADPHPGIRSALHNALEATNTVKVVREARDLLSAIKAVSAGQVDIVLADAWLAGVGSESARGGLEHLSRRAQVIVMGMSDPRIYTAPLQGGGAADYWPKRRRPRPTHRTVRRRRTPTPCNSIVSVMKRHHAALFGDTPSLGFPAARPLALGWFRSPSLRCPLSRTCPRRPVLLRPWRPPRLPSASAGRGALTRRRPRLSGSSNRPLRETRAVGAHIVNVRSAVHV